MSDHPFFITVEGSEGAGKSTQIARMLRWFEDRGQAVMQTREPGGTPVSEQIREILLHKDNHGLDSRAELLLMFAARAQLLHQLIRPALAAGVTVICDRFSDASYAYQGGGRGLPSKHIAALESLVHGDLQPDLTLLFDVPVETGLRRAHGRGEPDRFERETVAFFNRVRDTYLERADANPERFAVIDAGDSVESVWKTVEAVLETRLKC